MLFGGNLCRFPVQHPNKALRALPSLLAMASSTWSLLLPCTRPWSPISRWVWGLQPLPELCCRSAGLQPQPYPSGPWPAACLTLNLLHHYRPAWTLGWTWLSPSAYPAYPAGTLWHWELVGPCPAGCREPLGSLLLDLLCSSGTTLCCPSLCFAKPHTESLQLCTIYFSLDNLFWCCTALLPKPPSCWMQLLLFVILLDIMVKCFFPLTL